MKKKPMRLLTAALALTMLSGCGAARTNTENTAAETSINQAMLIEKSSQPQAEDYTFPEKFTGDWTAQDGRLTIHADADVVADLGTVLPTATVTPREFTQEDVDKLFSVLLKGNPLHGYVLTKQECQDQIDRVSSPDWQTDPDGPELTPEQLEQRRQEIIAYYTELLATAPEEEPIVHGFADSVEPNEVSGTAMVDGKEYEVSIRNEVGSFWTSAYIQRHEYKYRYPEEKYDWGEISREDAIALGNSLMEELGLTNMALDDVQPGTKRDHPEGTWQLSYVPTVDGIPLPGIREDRVYNGPDEQDGPVTDYGYWLYNCSEESNADTVSWEMERVILVVGQEGLLSFFWNSPSSEPVVQETRTALMPFDEIAAIADAMLPVVVTGPSDARSLVEIDEINGDKSYMDLDITKVSLSLMRVRDKGSLQGTIVPVWDFWGTYDWYWQEEDGTQPYMNKGANLTTAPMLTLNAIDGNVVSRLFGY